MEIMKVAELYTEDIVGDGGGGCETACGNCIYGRKRTTLFGCVDNNACSSNSISGNECKRCFIDLK